MSAAHLACCLAACVIGGVKRGRCLAGVVLVWVPTKVVAHHNDNCLLCET